MNQEEIQKRIDELEKLEDEVNRLHEWLDEYYIPRDIVVLGNLHKLSLIGRVTQLRQKIKDK